MKRFFFLLFITLLVCACNSQNSIKTNQIIKSKKHLFGLKSKDGNLLMDTIYRKIIILNEHSNLTLPANEKNLNTVNLPYYAVSDIEGRNAIFDENGKVVFPFIECMSLQINEKCQSVIVIKKDGNNRKRSYLYNLKGQLLIETNYKDIAFISNSDLLALIANDGQVKEYYLYQPSINKKLGPFDHFSIYNDAMSSFAMETSDFERLKKLNVITIRKEIDNEYQWGIIDLQGNEILALEYRNLNKVLAQDRNHPAFKRAEKPAGVEFIFKAKHKDFPSKQIYFDINFNKYEFITSPKDGIYKFQKL